MKYKVGDKLKRFTILEFLGTDHANKRLVKCLCDCGNIKILRYNNLKDNRTSSCGYYKAEKIKKEQSKDIKDIAAKSVLTGSKRYCDIVELSVEDVKKLIYNNCYYCEKSYEEVGTIYRKPVYDGRQTKRIGIDKIIPEKGYVLDNVVSCCFTCNKIKREHHPKKLIPILEKMIKNLKKLENKES